MEGMSILISYSNISQLLESLLLEFDHYLALYIFFFFRMAVVTSKGL
jgi:hypothetical protein